MVAGNIYGDTAMRAMRDGLRHVEGERQQLQSRFAGIDAKIHELVNRRGATMRELARVELPELSQEAIDQTFSAVRKELTAIRERRDRTRDDLEQRIQRLESSRNTLQTQIDQIVQQQQTAIARRTELEQLVTADLSAEPAFQELSSHVLKVEAELLTSEQRLQEVQREAAEKLPAYQRSSLFRYLQRRRFGEPGARRTGLTGYIDNWLARLIDYRKAIRSYQFLTLTPKVMEEELGRRKSVFNDEMERLEEMRTSAANRLGLTTAVSEVQQIESRLKTLQATAAQQVQETDKLQAERAELDSDRCKFYGEAIERLQQYLASARTDLLQSRAQSTTVAADDRLVAEIAALDRELNDLRPQIGAVQTELKESEAAVSRFELVVRRMENEGYSRPGVEFDSQLDLPRLVSGLTAGTIPAPQVLQQFVLRKVTIPEPVRRSVEGMSPTIGDVATTVGSVLADPATRVLLQAVINVAGQALAGSAERAVSRRSSSETTFHMPSGGGGWSSSGSDWGGSSGGSSSGGKSGFSKGDGF